MSNNERNCVPELAAGGDGGRDTDGVVEGQTKGLVDLLTTLAAVEEILLKVVHYGEERAAGGIRRCMHAVGTCYAAGQSS